MTCPNCGDNIIENSMKGIGYYKSHDCDANVPKQNVTGKFTTVLQRGDKRLSYYYTAGREDSFTIISDHHIRAIKRLGWVEAESAVGRISWYSKHIKTHWSIIHPTFYLFETRRQAIPLLRKYYSHVGGFDLADTDLLSPMAVHAASLMDLIMVPSEYSRKSYLNSGVKCRVEVVPHGLSKAYGAAKKPYPLKGHSVLGSPEARSRVPRGESPSKDLVNVLFFYGHSWRRKGADVAYEVMKRVVSERPNVKFIVKGRGEMPGASPPQIRIGGFLKEKELVRLYDACQILLAPSRGGGFELNVLEGLARGLVVITSDWPAIQEYAGEHVLTIKSKGKTADLMEKNPIHVGDGAAPDVDRCYDLVNYALDNLESLKKKAEADAPLFRKNYSWRKTARRILKCLE